MTPELSVGVSALVLVVSLYLLKVLAVLAVRRSPSRRNTYLAARRQALHSVQLARPFSEPAAKGFDRRRTQLQMAAKVGGRIA